MGEKCEAYTCTHVYILIAELEIITAMHSASVCRWRLDILNYTCTIRIVPSHQVVKTVMMHLRKRPTITKCKNILRCRNSCSAGAIETSSVTVRAGEALRTALKNLR